MASIGSSFRASVDQFLAGKTKRPRGNLIFALDATMSRQPTWDAATHLQSAMFHEVASIGTLDIQTVYFRGTHQIDAECQKSGWTSDPIQIARFMTGVTCRAGHTQIARTLDHALRESEHRKIGAMIYVGDACEEPRDHLMPLARRLADAGIPIFLFQEGHDAGAETIFREIAQITRGAHLRLDQSSSKQLGELLRAAAAFAVGGLAALEKQGSAAAKLLLGQVRGPGDEPQPKCSDEALLQARHTAPPRAAGIVRR